MCIKALLIILASFFDSILRLITCFRLKLFSKLSRLTGLVSPLLGQSSQAKLSMDVNWIFYQSFEGT
jgi:hypothetical protein